jgi:hypothetical protein
LAARSLLSDRRSMHHRTLPGCDNHAQAGFHCGCSRWLPRPRGGCYPLLVPSRSDGRRHHIRRRRVCTIRQHEPGWPPEPYDLERQPRLGRDQCRVGLVRIPRGGFFSSANGKRVEWAWKAPQERGGRFQLNGTAYDLANGTLFLVSTKGGQIRVTQLDVDLSQVQPDKQGFEAFAKEQPRIAQFFADGAGRK